MDLKILEWVNNTLHTNQLVTDIFVFITKISDTGFLWIILSLVLLLSRHTRKLGLYCLLSLGCCFVATNIILKNVIERPRPFVESEQLLNFIESINLELPDSHSFPSGHTAASFAVAFMIFLYNKRWGIPSMMMAILVGLSRVYLCVHFLTDVVAGLLVGIVIAYMMKFILEYFERRFYKDKYGYILARPYINRE